MNIHQNTGDGQYLVEVDLTEDDVATLGIGGHHCIEEGCTDHDHGQVNRIEVQMQTKTGAAFGLSMTLSDFAHLVAAGTGLLSEHHPDVLVEAIDTVTSSEITGS